MLRHICRDGFQRRDNIARLHALDVVRIRTHCADDTATIDDGSGRYRQLETVVTVADRKINSQAQINLAQVRRQLEHQAKRPSHFVSQIAQQVKRKPVILGGDLRFLGDLRRYRDQMRAETLDFLQHLLERRELGVAISSPTSAIKRNDNGSADERLLRSTGGRLL